MKFSRFISFISIVWVVFDCTQPVDESVTADELFQHFDNLQSFGTSADEQLSTFAGTVTYATTFQATGNEGWIALSKVNKGVTEVFVNDKPVGVNWYGSPLFSLENAVQKEENRLEIKYTTVLSNYCKSLDDNPTTERWTAGFENIPMGLEGAVSLYAQEEKELP